MLTKVVPASGDRIPALGMGSWRTFDVGADLQDGRNDTFRAFIEVGGSLIDSSPMYGRSQAVIGRALATLGATGSILAADKVWTSGRDEGMRQIEETRRRWGVERFFLLQVHNLVDWRTQLETLFDMKARGLVRHVGVTTYAGLRHDEVERIVTDEPVDFVQATYNILDREVETRILPLAAEKGVAFIANRPFREGALFDIFASRPLPPVAAEIGATSWAPFLLKFVISHPAVTCAIPATRRADHMRANMGALAGPVPDAGMRAEMLRAIEA